MHAISGRPVTRFDSAARNVYELGELLEPSSPLPQSTTAKTVAPAADFARALNTWPPNGPIAGGRSASCAVS